MLKKHYQISLFITFCILLNYTGKDTSVLFRLPIWMDCLGTVLAAYVLGPACGAVVGFTGNLIYGLKSPISAIYGITSAAIGIVAGLAARKGRLSSFFGAVSASVMITLISVVISTPLNLMFFGGRTGNLWGDGVIGYLSELGIHIFVASIVGEFYIDFADKLLCLLTLFLMIRIRRSIVRRKTTGSEMITLLAIVFLSVAMASTPALADEISVSGNSGNPEDDDPEGGDPSQNALPDWAVSMNRIHLDDITPGTNNRPILSDSDNEQHSPGYGSFVQTVFSSDNGLPCGEANAIAQTNDGILWIGTYAGLYRYNGNAFRWMDYMTSVRSVNCLFVDQEGRMWIGTNDNGLSICINETIVNVVDLEQGLPSNSVRSITRSSDGLYYIGTADALQILELNMGLKLLNTVPGVNCAISLDADESGHVAAVTADGMLTILQDREILLTNERPSDHEIYTCVAFDPDNLLYAGTSAGRILVYDLTDDDPKQVKIKICEGITDLNRLYFSQNGTLFICSDVGVGYFDDYNFQLLHTPQFKNSIDNMITDYQGNLWFTSSRLGVLRLSQSAFTNLYKAVDIEGKVVNTVARWKGDYYVGTDSGLDILDPSLEHPRFTQLSEMLRGIRIRCIRTDSKNNLWISTYSIGLLCVSDDGYVTVFDSLSGDREGGYGDRFRVTAELSDGTIAAAGDRGLLFLNDLKESGFIPYGRDLGNTPILSLLELDDGRLMVGTNGDGIAILKNREIIRNINRSDGLTSGVILRMVKSSEGGVYIVTSNGLCYMNSDGSIISLENFPYYNNYDVWIDDNGRLFVPGSSGIYVMEESELLSGDEDPDYELLNVHTGLDSALTANSWNMRDDNGNLFISCDNGLYCFNMNNYSAQNRSYRMMISSIVLDGVTHIPDKDSAFSIDRDVSKIEIFPEVINYTLEDPYVSYMLEGFDTSPVIVPQSSLSSIVYTNLPSGEYNFRLSVLDIEHNVIEESNTTLIKEKEIYDNQWFRVYMLVVMAMAVAWLTWFIVKSRVQHVLDLQRRELDLVHKQLQMGNETILAIAKTVDAKDELTSRHSQRVSEYSVQIASRMGFSEKECDNLRNAALLHDIGKIGIPDRILNKPEALDDEEYAIMKSHVTRGAEILKDFTLVDHVIDGTLYHHERYDGKGYANGLSGEDIPLYGRIIGVADAFDAMTANRVYRKKLAPSQVIDELKKNRGKQFDPQIIDILLSLIDDGTITMD